MTYSQGASTDLSYGEVEDRGTRMSGTYNSSDHVHGRSLYTGSAQSTTGLSALVTIGPHAVRSRATHDLWSHAEGA